MKVGTSKRHVTHAQLIKRRSSSSAANSISIRALNHAWSLGARVEWQVVAPRAGLGPFCFEEVHIASLRQDPLGLQCGKWNGSIRNVYEMN